jgi:uncharacterized protein YjbJ (UPF0337 family)
MVDRDRDRDLTERGLDNSLEGKKDHLKGHVKDAVGGLTGDSSLQAEGKMDQLKGKIQDKVGEVQRKLDRDV